MSNLSSFYAFLSQPVPVVTDLLFLFSKTHCRSAVAQLPSGRTGGQASLAGIPAEPLALWDLQLADFPSTRSATGGFLLSSGAKGDSGALI